MQTVDEFTEIFIFGDDNPFVLVSLLENSFITDAG